jgi:hypothetical protein
MYDSAVANRLPHSIFNRPNGEGGARGMWWPVLLLSPHPYTETLYPLPKLRLR